MATHDLDINQPKTRHSRRRAVVSIAVVAAVGLLAVGCGSSSSGGSGGSPASGGATPANGALGPSIGAAGSGAVYTTVGPHGETPTPASAVTLTPAEVTAVRNGHYTAAMVWHESATFTSAVTAGAQAEFKRLGIKVISVTQANFDAATQTNQLQTVEAAHPSAILSLPVNPTTEASAYKAVQKMGIKLVIMSNVPAGLTWPADYAGMVTDDLAQMGKEGAILLGTAMHGQGDVGFIYYNADYYVTNERDASFRSWLHKLYPGIHIVDQEPMANQSNAQTVATAMLTRYPNIQGIYVPWSQTPAEGVIAALRSLGRTNVKLVTDDLDPSIDANLMTGQYLAGIVADQPYLVGKTEADIAALAILGKKTSAFTDVTALPVTKSNLLSAWQTTLDQPAPANVRNAG
jgi:ribose transport system substrate-binding protein